MHGNEGIYVSYRRKSTLLFTGPKITELKLNNEEIDIIPTLKRSLNILQPSRQKRSIMSNMFIIMFSLAIADDILDTYFHIFVIFTNYIELSLYYYLVNSFLMVSIDLPVYTLRCITYRTLLMMYNV